MGRIAGAPSALRRRVLVGLLCLWLVAAPLTTVVALRSAWPPFGELPTAEQVRHARSSAWVAGVVVVLLPAAGLALARLWRSPGWTLAFLVGLMFAVLGSGFLLSLTDSPVPG